MERKYSTAVKAFLAFWLLFAHSFAEVCQKIDQCSCKKNSGKIISLWDIDGGSEGPVFKNIKDKDTWKHYVYAWNPCTKFSEGNGCKDVLSTTLTSKCACDDGCRPNPEGSGGSSGLSTGSILLIVFFVLIIVYIIGGILINKYKLGVESLPEMCPNYQFWAGIPSLIKDGVLFTCSGIKSACSTLCQKCNKESYADI